MAIERFTPRLPALFVPRLPCLRAASALATGGLLLVACGQREPDIDVASLQRVLTTLSADEMLGRSPFTPSIDKAASFIRDEFASIGLESPDGTDNYLQRFMGYRLQVQNHRVVLNGVEVPTERSAAWTSAAAVHWKTGDSVQVIVIGAEDYFPQVYSLRLIDDANALVLVNPVQEAQFRRFADLVALPGYAVDTVSGSTIVCVLTDEVDLTSYEVDVASSAEAFPLTNVVGVIRGGREDEIVLFGGHYDAMGIVEPVAGDSIANGANDGASATTAVIELARYFRALGKPERTLIFAAFTAEEIGFLGSEYLARQMEPTRVVSMFFIAAIGKMDARGPNTAYITGFERSDVGAILQSALQGTPYSFYPDPYTGHALFFRGDNTAFARLGIPAHSIGTISVDPRDEDLHSVSDEIETLDLNNMTGVMRAIALGSKPIISGEQTPTRIALPFRR